MDNFFLGLRSVLLEAKGTLSLVSAYPLFWGFAMGFLTSTLAHAFLIMDHPKHVTDALFLDKSSGFSKLYPARPDGTFGKSYVDYSRMVDRVKIAFLSASLFVTLVLFTVLLTK